MACSAKASAFTPLTTTTSSTTGARSTIDFLCLLDFWTRKAGPISYSVTYFLVVVISSLKIPKAFLIRSTAQQNFAYTFMLIFPTDLPAQIFSYRKAIIFCAQSSFHVTDLKLGIERFISTM